MTTSVPPETAPRPEQTQEQAFSNVPTQLGMTIIKEFTYRGAPEQWSNKYWWTGAPPSDETQFRTFFDALCTAECQVYTSAVTIVGGYGYNSYLETDPSVWAIDLKAPGNAVIPGTLPSTASESTAGDTAVFCWWKTNRKTSPGGKPVYLRKYFHDARNATGAGHDDVAADQLQALIGFAEQCRIGTIGGRQIAGQGHLDEVILDRGAGPFITTRTLKRRGKRPLQSAARASQPTPT